MKTVLVAINSKYIHSNPAIYGLKEYVNKFGFFVSIEEYTINQKEESILQSIYLQKYDIVMFSCYIWNIEQVLRISSGLKKVKPGIQIWLGGPEVTYRYEEVLRNYLFIDGIFVGEGEETLKEFMETIEIRSIQNDFVLDSDVFQHIKGLSYRRKSPYQTEEIVFTGNRSVINMDVIPFAYTDISCFENRIIYYESSRGCPFSCSYCLSSIDKRVRFKDLEIVKKELKILLDYKVQQVKFVDRTFNAKKTHTMEILKFIYENDNGITNFHFEITAELLTKEELELISLFRPGLVQFEIGVQTVNPETLKEICRNMEFQTIAEHVGCLQKNKNVHIHLDLIAGLPFEDFQTFSNSFNQVYRLRPDQLQLGFLKILSGSSMYENTMKYGLVYQDFPPYEILYNKWISYEEIVILKEIEEVVDSFYNTGQFQNTLKFLEGFYGEPFQLYYELSRAYKKNSPIGVSHSRISNYEFCLDFFENMIASKEKELENREDYCICFREILTHDLYLREKLKSRPLFMSEKKEMQSYFHSFYKSEKLTDKYLPEYRIYNSKQREKMTHMEMYCFHIDKTIAKGRPVQEKHIMVYDYKDRNKLDYSAKTHEILLEEIEQEWR